MWNFGGTEKPNETVTLRQSRVRGKHTCGKVLQGQKSDGRGHEAAGILVRGTLLAKGQAPVGVAKTVETCHWHDLTQNNCTTHICWSKENSLPVVIAARGGGVLWRLKGVDTKPIPASTFKVQDAGLPATCVTMPTRI